MNGVDQSINNEIRSLNVENSDRNNIVSTKYDENGENDRRKTSQTPRSKTPPPRPRKPRRDKTSSKHRVKSRVDENNTYLSDERRSINKRSRSKTRSSSHRKNRRISRSRSRSKRNYYTQKRSRSISNHRKRSRSLSKDYCARSYQIRSRSRSRSNNPGYFNRRTKFSRSLSPFTKERLSRRKHKSNWDIGENNEKQVLSQEEKLAQQQLLEQKKAASLVQQRLALLQQQTTLMGSRLCNKIYVGGLNYELNDEDIRAAFSKYGQIISLDMPIENNRSKGYCFIEYVDANAATNAVCAMNGSSFHDRIIKVGRPTAMQRASLNAAANMAHPPAWMTSPDGPLTGVKHLISPEMISGMGQTMDPAGGMIGLGISSTYPTATLPSLSNPSPIPQPNLLSNAVAAPVKLQTSKKKVYIGSVPQDLTSDNIKQIFESFGTITFCQLLPSPDGARHRGYGFIEYEEESAAIEAMDKMNGFLLCGRPIKVGPAKFSEADQLAAQGVYINPLSIQTGAQAKTDNPSIEQNNSGIGTNTTNNSDDKSHNTKLNQVILKAQSNEPCRSTCIVLLNMVSLDEIDSDLESEIWEECRKYGNVDDVLIHTGSSPDDIVQIFVFQRSDEDAEKGRGALDQRWFGGRVIRSFYYDREAAEASVYL